VADLAAIDYVVLAAYFLLMVAVGVYFFRFIKDIRGYYAGGHQIPWWVAGVSFYMSGFSAYIFVAYGGRTYDWGWPAITMLWAVPLALALGGAVFARLWRRAVVLTPVEFLETRYSLSVRQLFVWARVPVQLIDDGGRIFALAFLVHTATKVPLEASILACGVIVLVYTVLGGLWAVTVADVVQFIVLLGVTTLLVPMSWRAAGGWASIRAALPADHLQVFNNDVTPGFWLAFFAVMIVSFNSNWALIQRFCCVRDEREARRVAWLGAGLWAVTMPLFMLPCLAAPCLLPSLEHHDQAFVGVALKVLPSGMMGMALAAMFSATMAALAADYNVLAGVLTCDVYQRLLRPNASRKELVLAGRLLTTVIGIVTVILAWVLIRQHGLFDTILATFGLTGGPLAVPFLAGLVYRRGTSWGAVASLVGGVIAGLVAKFQLHLPYEWYALASIATSLVLYFAVSLVTRQSTEKQGVIGAFFDRLSRNVEKPPTASDGPSPFGVVGIVTLGLGATLALAGSANSTLATATPCWGLGGVMVVLGAVLARRSVKRFFSPRDKEPTP
jgi:SSS family transporter